MPSTPPSFITNRRKTPAKAARESKKSAYVPEEEAEELLQQLSRQQVRLCIRSCEATRYSNAHV